MKKEVPRKSIAKDYVYTIRLEKPDIEKAKKLNINIAEVCRLAIKQAIEALE